MMRCSSFHLELTDGVGKCSRPQWYGWGGECFCDAPAYGRQTRSFLARFSCQPGIPHTFPPYLSGLACPDHGGPATVHDAQLNEIKELGT